MPQLTFKISRARFKREMFSGAAECDPDWVRNLQLRPKFWVRKTIILVTISPNIGCANANFRQTVKVSKMASIKTNKNKKQTVLFYPIFHDIQLCFWSGGDSSPLKVFKMYLVFVWVCNQNIAYQIWNVLIAHSKKDKVHF